MLGILLAAMINVAPIVNLHLETAEGKQQLAQKLKVEADIMGQKWAEIQELQTKVQQKLALLDQSPKESPQWKALNDECQNLSTLWKQKTDDFVSYRQFIQTATVGIHQPDKILTLIEKYQRDENLTEEETRILENLSKICE